MKVHRPCSVCGKECAEYQRNQDGTYLHDRCAASVSPKPVLRSRAAEEVTDGA